MRVIIASDKGPINPYFALDKSLVECYHSGVIKDLFDGLANLVYPPHCLVCKTHLTSRFPREVLCLNCRHTIIPNIPPFCPKCSRHLINPRRPRCPDCIKKDPHFDFAWAACAYTSPVSDLICLFKYHQRTYLRLLFSRLMTDFLESYQLDIQQFDVLAPVPLFPSRLRERGFNQSQLLAVEISRKYRIGLSLKNLVRSRATEHQTLLSQKERWTNISGAFRIKNPAKLSGKNILIIDDLLTTGATASEAARTLKDAGAKTVGVLTLAITR